MMLTSVFSNNKPSIICHYLSKWVLQNVSISKIVRPRYLFRVRWPYSPQFTLRLKFRKSLNQYTLPSCFDEAFTYSFQISKLPFTDDLLNSLTSHFSPTTLRYLNGTLSESFGYKDVRYALMQFCELHLPISNDIFARKEFYHRLNSTLKSNYPKFPESFVSVAAIMYAFRSIWFMLISIYFVDQNDIQSCWCPSTEKVHSVTRCFSKS